VQANRPQLIWACLTLIRAWLAAGRPMGKEVMGSFESWAQVMGGIFEVVGIPGLLANRETLRRTAVAQSSEWEEFFTLWWAQFQNAPVKVADVYPIASDRELLDSVLCEGDARSQRTRLGKALGRYRDRVFGPYRLTACSADHSEISRWRLEQVSPASARAAVPTAAGEGGGGDFFDISA